MVAHLQFFQLHKAKQKTAKEPPSQRTPNRHEMTANNHDRKEGRSANSGFAKKRVQWLIEHLCFVSSGVLADSFVLCIRHLRQARKRYGQP